MNLNSRTLIVVFIVLLASVPGATAQLVRDNASLRGAPSQPSGLTPSELTVVSRTSGSLGIGWVASTGDVTYGVYLGNKRVASTTASTYAFTGLTCATSYRMGVDARGANKRSTKAWVSATTLDCPSSAPPPPPPPLPPPPPPPTFTLSVTKTGSGTGTITSSPSGMNCGTTCSATYNSGAVVTLSSSAGSSSTFAGYSGACSGTTCTVTVNSNMNVTATFNTSSSPAPTTGTNCFASPGACGFPDPASGNVGVPAGTTLTPSGSFKVTTAGTVIDGLNVSGKIDVAANNVTIKNTKVTATGSGCGGSTCGNSVIEIDGAYNVTIQNVEINAVSPTNVEHGIRNSHGGTITLDHVYQHGEIDAICWCGNATIRDSYSAIHLGIPGDHLENTYTDDNNLTVNHSVFLNNQPQTANIFGNTQNGGSGPCSNKFVITNNLFAGGGFTMDLCAHATSVGTSTATITGNRIARACGGNEVQGGSGTWLCPGLPIGQSDGHGYYPRGGSFQWRSDMYCGSPGWTWSGNVWDDNNATINC